MTRRVVRASFKVCGVSCPHPDGLQTQAQLKVCGVGPPWSFPGQSLSLQPPAAALRSPDAHRVPEKGLLPASGAQGRPHIMYHPNWEGAWRRQRVSRQTGQILLWGTVPPALSVSSQSWILGMNVFLKHQKSPTKVGCWRAGVIEEFSSRAGPPRLCDVAFTLCTRRPCVTGLAARDPGFITP